jgi:transcriptional regulator with XRE-family HTH domain
MLNLPTPQDFEIAAVRAGMTMAAVCREAGISPDVFSRWKRGGSEGPKIGSLHKIAAVLRSKVVAP